MERGCGSGLIHGYGCVQVAVFKPRFDTDQDYYAVLGVTPKDPLERVKNAYRTLARKFHPDAGPDADPYKFDQAAKAWAVLSDPRKRRYYDRYWKKKEKKKAAGKASPSAGVRPFSPAGHRSSPVPDLADRIDRISRQARKHGPFKEEYLEALMGLEKRYGVSTRPARQEILDHWLDSLKGIFGSQANLRDSYLAELTRMETTYGIDAAGARTDVLDTWARELKKLILEEVATRPDAWPKFIRTSRDYGYDVPPPKMTASKGRKKKRPTFEQVLAERMR